MENELINLLSDFGFPVKRQGSMTADEKYPPTFITFWENSESAVFYDDAERFVAYDFDVYVYSKNTQKVYDLLEQIRNVLTENNWIILNRGFDARSDEITHIGRGCEVGYIETKEETE